MLKIGYILLGWTLGILSTLFVRWLQVREEKKKKELDILSDTLKYIFKIRQVYNNLLTDKNVIERVSKEYPEKIAGLETKMMERFDKELADSFFPQLMFHSFQLKRLRDQSFWKDFEYLMNKYNELTDMTIGLREKENYSER
ncbi:MAG: hypothetical protein K8S18_08150, partial [Desulfobacula sp.]|nr:hypothetical protein [Desulfobacula sp.]